MNCYEPVILGECSKWCGVIKGKGKCRIWTHLGLKHFELAASFRPAEEFAPVPGRYPCVFGDPLLHVSVDVQVI